MYTYHIYILFAKYFRYHFLGAWLNEHWHKSSIFPLWNANVWSVLRLGSSLPPTSGWSRVGETATKTWDSTELLELMGKTKWVSLPKPCWLTDKWWLISWSGKPWVIHLAMEWLNSCSTHHVSNPIFVATNHYFSPFNLFNHHFSRWNCHFCSVKPHFSQSFCPFCRVKPPFSPAKVTIKPAKRAVHGWPMFGRCCPGGCLGNAALCHLGGCAVPWRWVNRYWFMNYIIIIIMVYYYQMVY